MTAGQARNRPLRVLVAHNAYQQRGGEDVVVAAECQLLGDAGHAVHLYQRHNDEVQGQSRVALLGNTLWSRQTQTDLRALFASFQPDVVHVHNTVPLISPSIYWAAHAARVPVVQTLHNFRLVCPQAQLRRDGQACQACVGKVPWRAAWHGCYRGSAMQSAAIAMALQLHRGLGTWQHRIGLYIALSAFCQQTFVDGGISAERIRLKPNFVPDQAGMQAAQQPRTGLLFVGRLTVEKGVGTLARAWASTTPGTLTVVGEGPAAQVFANAPGITMMGPLPPAGVAQAMAAATALVVPSVWPEMFGLVVIEAYAAGLPVIASRIGALAELVEDGVTGLLVRPDDAADLASKLAWAQAHPDRMAAMGAAARQRYLDKFTPAANLRQLEAIYDEAIGLGAPA